MLLQEVYLLPASINTMTHIYVHLIFFTASTDKIWRNLHVIGVAEQLHQTVAWAPTDTLPVDGPTAEYYSKIITKVILTD